MLYEVLWRCGSDTAVFGSDSTGGSSIGGQENSFWYLQVEACGDNLDAAKKSGIRVVFYTVTAYVICNLLTAMAGIFDAGSVSSADPMALGILMEMDAIAATVIGGTSITGGRPNFVGTVFGVFILQIITIMINMNNISEQWSYIITAAIIIAAVVFQNLKKMKEA
ncbi:MAG: ABC transporter permease [Enterocloster sp.]